MDPDLLLAFLARPRTLEEVAQRFGMSFSEAGRLVIKAVESGQILVSSQLRGRGGTGAGPPRAGRTSLESNPLKGSRGMSGRGLVQFGNSRVPARIRIGRGDVLFKLRPDKASTVRRAGVRPQASEFLGLRKERLRRNGRVSLSEEIYLLEMLSPRPRSLDELRGLRGVSRDIVERFVRNGLLRCDWGPKGVGNFYKITHRGMRELRRLKTASRLDAGIVGKGLISVKRVVPQ